MSCQVFAVILPWPPKGVSQNDRVHYQVRAKATKAYREECMLRVRSCAGSNNRPFRSDDSLMLKMSFASPNKRRRDLQNLVGSMKAAIDGVFDALGVDDSIIGNLTAFFDNPSPKDGGHVTLELIKK